MYCTALAALLVAGAVPCKIHGNVINKTPDTKQRQLGCSVTGQLLLEHDILLSKRYFDTAIPLVCLKYD